MATLMELLFASPLNVMYFYDEDKYKREEKDLTNKDHDDCVKLKLKENLVACIEKRDLLRNNKSDCSYNVQENFGTNYVIVKQIISNLQWQDKHICKLVCSTWYSAVQILQKEQLIPEDFVMDLDYTSKKRGTGWFRQSGIFKTEPLVIFTFASTAGFSGSSKCCVISPRPCDQICDKDHSLVDLINNQFNAPKNCMLTVRADFLVYKPLPYSSTYGHSINYYNYSLKRVFLSGLYIPKIPNVEFQVLNILSQSQDRLQQEFYNVVEKLSKDHIIKGVLVYATEKYILNSVEDIVFLNYFKDVQPDIPYALGGCIIGDTMSDDSDINLLIDNINEGTEYMSENLISIGLFTIPKNVGNNEYNFDMYSFVIDSSEWSKQKIQDTVTEFSQNVPRFEYSIAIKLSCVGRDQKHLIEQDCFRQAFPDTKIVGCYGNGELGVYHPPKQVPVPLSSSLKRRKRDPGPDFGIMYSYSTVFVYIGWGKIISSKGPAK